MGVEQLQEGQSMKSINTWTTWPSEGYWAEDYSSVLSSVPQASGSGRNRPDSHPRSSVHPNCWTLRSSWGRRRWWWVAAWRRTNTPTQPPDGRGRPGRGRAFCRRLGRSLGRRWRRLLVSFTPILACPYRDPTTTGHTVILNTL